MAKYVDRMVADWAEMEGVIEVQGKKVDLLQPHFEKLCKKTNAGTVCIVHYSKFTDKKQTKYTGKKLLAWAKNLRRVIVRFIFGIDRLQEFCWHCHCWPS